MIGGGSAPRATVVVCTRNRSVALASACEAALALATELPWRLLIVDNASTDDTLAVARAIAARHSGRVEVAVEPELGLSAARNLGVRLARGEWLAFLDDDAAPLPGWLDAYDRLFADEPAVTAAGGPVDPEFTSPLPAWFGPQFLPYLSAWDRGGERHDLEYSEFPRGANMAFRCSAFARCGDFERGLGRRGRSLRSCEEIELCLRIARAGGRVTYEPGARVRHRVEGERLTPAWLLARFDSQGFSEAIVEWRHFGWRGVAAGLRRHRDGALQVAAASPGTLDARCHARARSAYLRGALYAALFTARWNPPAPAQR